MPRTKHWKYSEELVLTSLRGLTAANPELNYLEAERTVFVANGNENKVTILSGGGAGHEPLHAGYVGSGMLDVAVSGQVFASPSVKQIYAGVKAVPSKKGTLMVVKNYSGDVLHFSGLCAERLNAEGYPVKCLIVADDVSVGRSKSMVGRRGLAGTALIHKVVGAKSAKDGAQASLDEVFETGSAVNANLVTIGASLDHVNIPKLTTEDVQIEEDDDDDDEIKLLSETEIEIGMGIHNEPGVQRMALPHINELIKVLIGYLLDQEDTERSFVPFKKTDQVALLVNNLGATSNLEIYSIQTAAMLVLKEDYGIVPVRVYTGTFVTSLDGPGFSLTLLNITGAGGEEILECLDYPTTAPAWPSHASTATWTNRKDPIVTEDAAPDEVVLTSNVTFDSSLVSSMLETGCDTALAEESKITAYDTIAGDGDCGETLARGCHSVKNALATDQLELTDAVKLLCQLTNIIETEMGGTSGGIYCVFISGIAHSFIDQEKAGGFAVDSESMATALTAALTTLEKYTKARVGDRTLMDALIPFVETFASTKDLKMATEAAVKGAESTRALSANFGRSSYVSDEILQTDGGIPDPGSIGLAAILTGFTQAYYS